ncbi:Z1 domain-containing protein [Micromonospora sp. NPDC000089]|uniref:Z1 domain-containing protein n=1 Tax=unclassified Micromonospora TaxID=2617518 RepID=UPI0036B4AE4A
MSLTPYDEVRGLVMTLISAEQANGRLLTPQFIEARVSHILDMYWPMKGAEFVHAVDRVALVRDVESSCNVFIPSANVMEGDEDHDPWLDESKSSIEWRFWDRYRRYVSTVGKMPPSAVDRLDEITDMVLGRLERPSRKGPWDRRGLVAGQVQSGKTGNYIGLTCKAIDAGYKLVIVLAGIHNSLRAQTQARVDEGVLGFSTEKALRYDAVTGRRVGVGLLAGQYLHVNSFTSRKQNGDFNLRVAEQVGVNVGGSDPVVLVVKKNKSVLTNLLTWATSISAVADPTTGKQVVRGVPMLVIDDEADQASVDTNGPRRGVQDTEYAPSVINGLVRQLLDRFEQSSYVGYTATPFANIFIDPDVSNEEAGQSLFPRSFILSLPAPSNYIGPSRVFGLKEDISRNIEFVAPLPMVRRVADFEAWMPDGHRRDHVPGPMPRSLREAILAFVLTCAVRRWRGQSGKHNSMLVHVTRFVDVQRHVRDQVSEELERLQNHLRLGEISSDLVWHEAGELYGRDFVRTTDSFGAFDDLSDQTGKTPSWSDLQPHLPLAASSIAVKLINGSAADALDYVDHPDGIHVIAVGGAKLSRGLTLEGLSISYYLRGSRMYDTLMQMGRWFGYRSGYLDLCRLYTTDELAHWYALITEASEELYHEFDYMVALGSTPREFGLRVQQHPDGLMVTSPNRMRTARLITMSFAGNLSETVLFQTSGASRKRNWTALRTLVEKLPSPDRSLEVTEEEGSGGNYVWRNVPAGLVAEFFASYTTHEDAYKVQPRAIRDYILSRTQDDPPELTDWWILLANSSSSTAGQEKVGTLRVGLTKRGWHSGQIESSPAPGRFPIRRLVSPSHERVDIVPGTPQYDEALQNTREMWASSPRKNLRDKEPSQPAGIACRRVRPPSRGLLILYPLNLQGAPYALEKGDPFVGFAVSFPGSTKAKPMEYQVTKDAWLKLHQPHEVEEEDFEDDEWSAL